MDWEQLAIIAQIATGVATLALAAFSVGKQGGTGSGLALPGSQRL